MIGLGCYNKHLAVHERLHRSECFKGACCRDLNWMLNPPLVHAGEAVLCGALQPSLRKIREKDRNRSRMSQDVGTR